MTRQADAADVIVIGAGFAGITAARELIKAGKRVIVLEARDRVGGRAMAGTVAGQPIDHGGQWVGADHERFRHLAAEAGIGLYPQYTEGKSILEVDGTMQRIGTGIPKLPILSLLELGIGEKQLSGALKRIPDSGPWNATKARSWDAQSLGSWLESHSLTQASKSVGALLSNAIFCAHPSQVSYLYALECFRQGGGVEKMLNVEDGNQQDKVEGGLWSVIDVLARELGDVIRLDAPVSAIAQGPDSARVTTTRGEEYTAEHVVITAPPSLHHKIAFAPELPPRRKGLMERMAMGSVIKAHIAYDRPFWRQQGLNGAVASTNSALGLVFDQSLNDDGPGVLVTLIEGSHAVEFSALAPEDRRQAVVDELTRFFGQEAAAPIDYTDHDWNYDEWTQGGYGCYMPPGVVTSFGPSIREPFGRLHWAGTETARQSIGYFEGAIESGLRVAEEITTPTPRP